MLLNIDKPLRTAILHEDGCSQIPRPVGTQYKPVGELGRDGGWFTVSSVTEGKLLAAQEYQRAEFAPCSHCCET